MLLRPPRVTRTYNSFPTLRSSDLLGSALAALIAPSVAEAGIVLDTVEVVVDVAELLANPLDEGPHVGPVAVRPVAGDEVLAAHRSEEHTSELQSLMRISYAVFCLKKKITNNLV